MPSRATEPDSTPGGLPEVALNPAEALAALEAFVVDNDDLVALEERIGRFNIFDALGIVRAEIRHSNFLAWLLDPGESHGAGQVFLRAVLMDMLRNAPHADRPMSPVELDGLELGGVEVRREADNIDILIAADDPRLVVAIENKIDSGEHSNQLERYRESVARRFPDHAPLFVFLTREGDEPSDDAWTPYSYADLHATLSRVRRLQASSLSDDVRAFLDHYLRMIRSRFMDDPKIDELCDRIYRNHRQALDLIFEHRADPRSVLLDAFQDALAEMDGFAGNIVRHKNRVMVNPATWDDYLPNWGPNPARADHRAAYAEFKIDAGMTRASMEVWIGPATDKDRRRRYIEAARELDRSYGFSQSRRAISDSWTCIHSTTVLKSKGGIDVDENSLEKVRESARSFTKLADKLTDGFREIRHLAHG